MHPWQAAEFAGQQIGTARELAGERAAPGSLPEVVAEQPQVGAREYWEAASPEPPLAVEAAVKRSPARHAVQSARRVAVESWLARVQEVGSDSAREASVFPPLPEPESEIWPLPGWVLALRK